MTRTIPAKANPSGAWAPLQQPVFRAIWLSALIANVGTWIHDVAAGWTMTTLTDDVFLVALVQSALTLPVFLVALPAGVMADLVDRRHFLIVTQLAGFVAASGLALLAALSLLNPGLLLLFTFLLGMALAFSQPAWQAIVPELVPHADVRAAVTLNSLGINIARAIGPALAGGIIAVSSPALAFALNAAAFLVVVYVLVRWRRAPQPHNPLAETPFGAVRAGLRYVRRAPGMQIVLVRAAAFFSFGSVIWALLPLLAQEVLGQGSVGYGVLLSSIGVGAVIGALTMPRLRARLRLNQMVILASALYGLVVLTLAFNTVFELAVVLMLLVGFCWITVVSSLNASAQLAVPDWVRARALAVYLVVFYGGMSGGGALWGAVGEQWGIPVALMVGGGGLLIGIVLTRSASLNHYENIDLGLSDHWAGMTINTERTELEQGPVMVTVDYRIDANDREAFLKKALELRALRLRNGALTWLIYHSKENDEQFQETFTVANWGEHLRQHTRETNADHAVHQAVNAFHKGPDMPAVRHFVAQQMS